MDTLENTPTIFLNRIEFKGKSYVKLHHKTNDAILKRINKNDWIRYSVKFNSYYIVDNEKNIVLVKELISDIAEVSIKYLDWKPRTQPMICANNIGIDYYNRPPIEKRETLACITLFPYEKEGKN